jgi:hypothetical protein
VKPVVKAARELSPDDPRLVVPRYVAEIGALAGAFVLGDLTGGTTYKPDDDPLLEIPAREARAAVYEVASHVGYIEEQVVAAAAAIGISLPEAHNALYGEPPSEDELKPQRARFSRIFHGHLEIESAVCVHAKLRRLRSDAQGCIRTPEQRLLLKRINEELQRRGLAIFRRPPTRNRQNAPPLQALFASRDRRPCLLPRARPREIAHVPRRNRRRARQRCRSPGRPGDEPQTMTTT